MTPHTKQLIEKIKATDFFKMRQCSICDSPIGWRHDGDDIYFDSNCWCTSYYTEPRRIEPASLDFYTEQEFFRKKFGLTEPTQQDATEV